MTKTRGSWLRVESSTIDPDLTEGLAARVADPLWLLARQWQAGEFTGEDAANPLLVSMSARSVHLDRLTLADGTSHDLSPHQAAEPLVERESVRRGPAAPRHSTDLARLLVRALQHAGDQDAGDQDAGDQDAGRVVAALQAAFPPTAGGTAGPEPGVPDEPGRRRLRLLASAGFDGSALLRQWQRDPRAALAALTAAGLPRRLAGSPGLRALLQAWAEQCSAAFSEPEDAQPEDAQPGAGPPTPPAWRRSRLEYSCSLRARVGAQGGDLVLEAPEYPGGRLSWWSFDRVDAAADEPAGKEAGKGGRDRGDSPRSSRDVEVLPTPLRFRGMPAARFWEMEEAEVFLGGLATDAADLARAALATYATVYGDDWLVVPLVLEVGTLTQVTSLQILDDFGGRTEVPATATLDGPGRTFRFFESTGDPGPEQDGAPALFLAATVEVSDAGRALEDVRFHRDDGANLAWAVETQVESVAGNPIDLTGRGTPARGPRAAAELSDGGAWAFRPATQVPSSWVPLLPVRLIDATPDDATPDDASIAFQRGRMADGAEAGARGRVLEPHRRLLLREEEVLSTGIRVVRRFQSTRDTDGSLSTWVGRRKGPGRPLGDSGLVFDEIEPEP